MAAKLYLSIAALLFLVWGYLPMPVNAQQQIVEAEYFLNTDPGPGNGTPIAINDPDSSVVQGFSIDLTGVEPGFHLLCIRVRSSNGFWHIASTRFIHVNPEDWGIKDLEGFPNPLVYGEYFIDEDPGPGNGIPFSMPIEDEIDIFRTAEVDHLEAGSYQLGVRVRKLDGHWSSSFAVEFTVEEDPDCPTPQMGIDRDPNPQAGESMALSFSGSGFSPTAMYEWDVDANGSVDYTGQQVNHTFADAGIYDLRLRVVDTLAACSFMLSEIIQIEVGPIGSGEIAVTGDLELCEGETVDLQAPEGSDWLWNTGDTSREITVDQSGYFQVSWTDTNGNKRLSNGVGVISRPYPELDMTVNPANNGMANGSALADVTGGSAVVYDYLWSTGNDNPILAQVVSGTYSLTVDDGFCPVEVDAVIPELSGPPVGIIAAEYFVGTDPGPGQGTEVVVSQDEQINSLFEFDVSALPQGISQLYFRVQSDLGFWGAPRRLLVIKDIELPELELAGGLQRVEYFFADDPGPGTPPSFIIDPAQVEIDELFSIDVSALSPGIRQVFIRVQNEAGFWSVKDFRDFFISTTIENYSVIDYPLVQGEYFFNEDPGPGKGTYFSVPVGDSIDILRIADLDDLEPGTHKVGVRVKTLDNQWSQAAFSDFEIHEEECDLPAADFTFVEDGAGEPVLFTASSGFPQGVIYEWDFTGDGEMDQTGIETSYVFPETGLYEVLLRVSLNDSCFASIVKEVAVGTDAEAPIAIDGSTETCSDEPTVLTAPTGSDYLWNTGEETQSIEITESGTYSAVFTDPSGLRRQTNSVSITVYSRMMAEFNISPANAGQANGSARAFAVGGNTFNPDFNWSTGSEQPIITDLSAGTYYLTISDPFCPNEFEVVIPELSTAEGIVAAEYFIDEDPGPGNGVDFPVPAMPVISSYMDIDPTSIPPGSRYIYYRVKSDNGFWSPAKRVLLPFSQEIPEYVSGTDFVVQSGLSFFNEDPGIAESAALQPDVVPAGEIDQSFEVDVDGLSPGSHFLYTRVKSSEGWWSDVASAVFFVLRNIEIPDYDTTAYPLVSGELFFGEDPGAGNAYSFNLPATHLADVLRSVPTEDLEPGIHTAYVRVRTLNGMWSSVEPVEFTVYPKINCENPEVDFTYNPALPGESMELINQSTGLELHSEHFWDIGANGEIDYTTEDAGHIFSESGLYDVRLVVANGICISSVIKTVEVGPYQETAVQLSSDPPFCDGDSLVLTAPEGSSYLWNTGEEDRTIEVQTSGTYQVTYVDLNGTARTTAPVELTVNPPFNLEVFSSPALAGMNNGSAYVKVSGGSFPLYTYNWSTGGDDAIEVGLQAGTYTLTVSDGICEEVVEVTIEEMAFPEGIIAAELYLGTEDPGPGNALMVDVSSGASINSFFESLVGTLDNGTHWLNMRVKSENGFWSSTKRIPFAIFEMDDFPAPILPDLVSLEYISGTDDPGPGLGEPLGISGPAPEIDEPVILDLSDWDAGVYEIFIRANDSEDSWSQFKGLQIEIVAEPPVTAICQDASLLLDNMSQGTILPEDLDAGSFGGSGSLSLSVSNDFFDCSHVGGNTILLFVEDQVGDIDSCVSVVTVINEIVPFLVDDTIGCSSLDQLNQEVCFEEALEFDATSLEGDVTDLFQGNCTPATAELMATIPRPDNTLCDGWELIYLFLINDDEGNSSSCVVRHSGGGYSNPELELICPDNFVLPYCPESEMIVEEAYAMWQDSFMFEGGCATLGEFSLNPDPPGICGGVSQVTFGLFSDCEDPIFCSRTFTVEAPPELTVECPEDLDVIICSQGSSNWEAEYQEWLEEFEYSGGCNTNGLLTEAELFAEQFANEVIDFSSQWSSGSWSAEQILGAPDVYPNYGSNANSWTHSTSGGQREFIEIGFSTSAAINTIRVYETDNPGSIDTVYVRNPHSGEWEEVYSGEAAFAGSEARIFEVNFPLTAFEVNEVRLALNTPAVSGWNEIDAVSISNIPLCGGSSTVLYQAISSCGDTVQCERQLTLSIEELMVSCPEDIAVSACGDSALTADLFDLWLEEFYGSGGCNSQFTDLENVSPPDSCGASVTIVFEGQDDCDNEVQCSSTFTLQSGLSEITALCSDLVVELDSDGFAEVNPEDVNNSSYGGVGELSFSLNISSFTCADLEDNPVVLTVSDESSNSDTCHATITVLDSEAPSLICPDDIVVSSDPGECGAVVNFEADASDNCGVSSLEYTDEPGSFFEWGFIDVFVTATDASGNLSECSFSVTVEDDEAPVWTSCPEDFEVNSEIDCELEVNWEEPAATDNCGPVTINQTAGPENGSFIPSGTYEVVYEAVDGSGNVILCSFDIEVNGVICCDLDLEAYVYLEGALLDPSSAGEYFSEMRTNLNSSRVLPGQSYFSFLFGLNYTEPGQPYYPEPWNYYGDEGAAFDSEGDLGNSSAGYASSVVDWVLVTLRPGSSPVSPAVWRTAALLHKDGSVELLRSLPCCSLDEGTSYYLMIQHRNHMPVMSHQPLQFVNGVLAYDFRSQDSYIFDIFGFGAVGQKEVESGVYAMFAGNGDQTIANQSQIEINFNDKQRFDEDLGIQQQYSIGDYNLDGNVQFNDKLALIENLGSQSSVSPVSSVATSEVEIDCESAELNGSLSEGEEAEEVWIELIYTSGCGEYAGQEIASTGVEGLTATLEAGVFEEDGGVLVLSISGTPNSGGTALFLLNIAGETCSLEVAVESSGPSYPTGTVHCDPDNPTEVVEVLNPATGRIWMDRNLGASQVATSSTDSLSYGDLYQWGRGADGHQCRNSATTTTLSSTDQPGHGDFILVSNSPFDWRSPQNTNLWQGLNGVNNPCPDGYRLPTESELDAERLSWSSNNAAGAIASPLKLPVAGGRNASHGALGSVGTLGSYWNSTVSSPNSRYLFFLSSFANMETNIQAVGASIRCIKDETPPPGTIESLDVGSATLIGSLTEGEEADGVSSEVPYTGGNGGFYDGQTVSSTGVTGMTATLAAGTFEMGSGTLTYVILGTPESSGIATFELEIGGQSGDLEIEVEEEFPFPLGVTHCDPDNPTEVIGIINPATGRMWMDRNLGAKRAAIGVGDEEAFGDLYQWGRFSDGHQCRDSDISSETSSVDQPSHPEFIINPDSPLDWRIPQNSDLWGGLSGQNNPCPEGYRLPTKKEFEDEADSWFGKNISGAYNSIKLTLSGSRSVNTGEVVNESDAGFYWTSSKSSEKSEVYAVFASSADFQKIGRGNGASVRCIYDEVVLGAIQGLDCDNARISDDLVEGEDTDGITIEIDYFYGNGGPYSGMLFNSFGVSGITASLDAGLFVEDSLSYITLELSGTPLSAGVASFNLLNIGSQECTLEVPVLEEEDQQVDCGDPTEVVEVLNPATGRIWMDRNLGASRAALFFDDAQSYGDLYQWGRFSDGHQCRDSDTTSTLSSSDQPGHGDFILAPNSPLDWRSPQNGNLWQGVNGDNNPCPDGFRLPTESEWEQELSNWSQPNRDGAFQSNLKLPSAGSRLGTDGTLLHVGNWGDYWSSTVDGNNSRGLIFHSIPTGGMTSYFRRGGLSVRCIKD